MNKIYFNGIVIFVITFILLTIFNKPSSNIPAHVDEPSVVETAIRISNGSLNPEFFRYPSGHMNSLAVMYKIAGYFSIDLTIIKYYKIAWAFSRVCIAGIAAMVFLICTINMNIYFGILGSVLISFNPLLRSHANFAIVDVTMAFFVTLFFLMVTILYSKSRKDIKYLLVLPIIVGIAISMKYTAALLIPSLLFISSQFVYNKEKYLLQTNYLKILLLCLGIIFGLISIFTIVNQQLVLDYLLNFTTDGIIEIEYLKTLTQVVYLFIVMGFCFILLRFWHNEKKDKILGILFSPINGLVLLSVIMSFFIFSPYTLIEWKLSFADFMYEYRHMKIGSAAQYHHQSDEYIHIISNLSSSVSVLFYIKLFLNNFGFTGLLLGLYGIVKLYLRKPKYLMSLLIYLLLVLFTLFSWKNVATRYTLSILPLMVVFFTFGAYELKNMIVKKYDVFQK